MTLHSEAITSIAKRINGKPNHKLGGAKKFVGKEPDIIVNPWPMRQPEIHEVEVVAIPYDKMRAYRNYRGKKVLWLVLPIGSKGVFQEVNVMFGPKSNELRVK